MMLADSQHGLLDAQEITNLDNLLPFSQAEESMTLTSDGLTIIGVATDGRTLLTTSRSAIGATDFMVASQGPFATLNFAIPKGGGLSWLALSTDGLAFYYRVDGAADATKNGVYEAVRASTSALFPPGQRMAGDVQQYRSVSGISSDRMTLFVGTDSCGTVILTRNSLSQPFTAPAMSAPPMFAWRVMPLGANCGTVIGTCEPGGCVNEQLCLWHAQ
jgi:hypothetical protein